MSQPERLENKVKEYDTRNDVWSLGVSLLELALRKFPFSTDDQLIMLNAIQCGRMAGFLSDLT